MRTTRQPNRGRISKRNPPTEGEREWLRMCSELYHKLAARETGQDLPVREEGSAEIPEFATVKEYDAWCETLPSVEPDVDPRLCERVKTSIRLSKMVIDGFNHLAEQRGIRSGQTLMKMVLENFLARNLPPDF